jgi:hypothetical protein
VAKLIGQVQVKQGFSGEEVTVPPLGARRLVKWEQQSDEGDLPEFHEGGGARADEQYTLYKRVHGRNNPSNGMMRRPPYRFHKKKKGGPPGPRAS